MTNYSRTTLRELKKRYLNILKKCFLANLMAFSFVLPSMAEEVLSRSADEIYKDLIAGRSVTLRDEYIVGSVTGGVFTGSIQLIDKSNLSFSDIVTLSKKGIDVTFVSTGGSTLNFESAIFSGGCNKNTGGIVSFSGDAKFENIVGPGAIWNHVAGGSVIPTFLFKKAEFYNNSAMANTGWSKGGAIYQYGARMDFEELSIFGKYVVDDSGNYTLNEDGAPMTLGNYAYASGNQVSGGGIYNSSSRILFNHNVTFIGNYASGTIAANGGAIVNDKYSSIQFMGESLFELNKSISVTGPGTTLGGAISNQGTLSFNKKSIFGGYLKDSSGDYILTSNGDKISVGNVLQAKASEEEVDGEIVLVGSSGMGGAISNSGIIELNGADFVANSVMSEASNARGGGISNTELITISGPSLFQDNIAQGAKAYGGAIYNESGTKNNDGTIKTAGVTLRDVSFIGNKAESTTTDGEAKGGAIYNQGTMKFNGEAVFENNIAKNGGAIYNDIGATLEFNKKAEFVGNEASERGSVIFSNSGNITFNDNAIFNDNKGTGWGTIANHYATINFNSGAEFKNNRLDGDWKQGGAIFNLSSNLNFNDPDKTIVFEGNSVETGCGGSLYHQYGTINFKGDVVFKGKEIIDPVTGETELMSQATSGGAISSSYGTILFEKGVLFEKNRAQNGGAIGITGGTVTFKNGVEFSGNRASTGNDVYFNEVVGTINFGAVPEDLNQIPETVTGAEIVEGGFASKDEKGIVNKYSNSTLTFLDSADNTGFKGTFNQYIGKTIANSEKFLAGTNNILGGVLETHGAKIGYTANIGDETHTASLIHHSTATGTSAPTSLTKVLKIGASSTALFDSATNGIQANYKLTEDMADAGTVTFKDVHITLGQRNYNGAYVMDETVTLDLQDGDTPEEFVSFANLTGSANLKIDVNIVNGANGLELVTDQIVTNQEATFKLALTDVVLSKNALDNGLSDSYTATVMKGGTLTYGSGKGFVATDVYQYEVSGANNQITIDAVKFNEGSDVMKSVAEFDGDAAFNMTIGGDSYEMQSDVVMTKNTKSIIGKDKETSTLTAKKITVNGATLNVENVSVSGENQLIDVASGTLNVTNAKVDNIENAGKTTLDTAEVSKLENAGTLTANSSTIGELVNGNKAEVTGGELETATNKEKGMLSLSAGLRAGTVTNEGALTLDAVTVADLTNSATLKANGSTIQKLVNEQEAELTASTVEDLTNTGTMTAKDLTLKGALKGEGTATLSGKLVADDIFKSENKIISDSMKVSENIQKMELADLEIKEGTTLDIGTREVTAKEVSVGKEATLQVTLNDLEEHGTMKADKIEAGAGAGVHLVLGEKFEGGVFDVFKGTKGAGDLEVKHNNLYNVVEVEEGKYSFMTKDTEALQESLGATKEEVSVADAMTKGTSTNEAFNKVQSEVLIALQSLESETVEKAKKALSAVGAKEHPIEQSVASEHLVALQNVVQSEMHGTTVGHSGGDTDPRAKVYIKGLYDRTKSSMGEGFRARSKGAVLGVQSEVTDTLTLGVGYATSQTTAKEDLRRTEVVTNTGFISAHYQPNAWWVSGLATFSRGEYEEEKQILSSMGKATYDVDSWGAQVMTGYDIKLENAIITPEVGMRYLSVKQEGYTDTLGTTVAGTRSDYLTALVGVKGTWDMGAIRPTAGVTVGYDIISDDVSALNTLANGASYTVNGEALDRLSTGVSLGVEADLGERTTLKLEYSGTFRKEYQDHSGMLKFELRF